MVVSRESARLLDSSIIKENKANMSSNTDNRYGKSKRKQGIEDTAGDQEKYKMAAPLGNLDVTRDNANLTKNISEAEIMQPKSRDPSSLAGPRQQSSCSESFLLGNSSGPLVLKKSAKYDEGQLRRIRALYGVRSTLAFAMDTPH